MRRRLVLSIAGVAIAAVVLLAVPLAVVVKRSYREEDLLRLQRDTIAASRAIDVSGQNGDPIELPSMGAAVAVYDRAGRRLTGSGPPVADPLATRVLRTGQPADTSAGDRLVVAVPLLARERVAGVMRTERRASAAARDTRNAWLVIAGIAVVIILAAAGAAVVLGRRLAQPLERLTVAARRLGQGDFSVRAGRDDVPEVDAVASALDATAQRLGELVDRERAFTTAASHQLRTPLAALRLELEALELREPETPELVSAIAAVDRLETTIETLLSLARDVPPGDSAVAMEPVLAAARSRWHGVLAAEARPLRVGTATGLPPARAAEPVVNEIVDILVDNARRHGAGAITVRVHRREAWLALEVGDEGAGFAAAREGANGAGHGIGLRLAASLAHAAGGRLVLPAPGPRPVVTLMLAISRTARDDPPAS